MTKKKIIAFILVFSVIASSLILATLADGNDNLAVSNKSDTLPGSVQINGETGEFTVIDEYGHSWKSNPVFGGFDEKASGMEKTNQRSQLMIKYLDESNIINETNSFVDCDSIQVESGNSGATLKYTFSELGFVIPLTLSYADGCLFAKIDSSEIKETANNTLLTVTILPYFGSGEVGQNGYVFVPDGCGAIINLSENNAHVKSSEKKVYGDNLVVYKKYSDKVEEQVYLPVFGVKENDSAFLGIITEGDGISTLRTNISSGYYTCAPTFDYRQLDSTHLQEGSKSEKEVEVVPKITTKSDFCVKYVFLNGEKANYIGMAEAFRNHLSSIAKINNNARGISLDLTFMATAQISKSFLGIPYNGLLKLTDIEDISDITDVLTKSDISGYNISVNNALGSGKYGKLNRKVSINSNFASYNEYNLLRTKLEKSGTDFYLNTDFFRVYKTGNGVSASSGTARNVSGAISKQYNFYPESFGKDESLTWMLVNAKSLKKITSSFSDSINNKKISLGLNNMANTLYGDYRLRNTYDRQAMLSEQISAYVTLAKSAGKMYFNGANSYILPFASMVSNIPLKSSQYDFYSYDIPFYQIVMHGYVDYSSSALNLSGDFKTNLLKSVEYGSALKYELVCQNFEELPRSSESQLFSSLYDNYAEEIIKYEIEISDFYRANSNADIIGHKQISENVYETLYSNGNRSIVNYSDTQIQISGKNIGPQNYGFFMEGES